MKEITPKNPLCKNILNVLTFDKNITYRLFSYVLISEQDEGALFYNTLTLQMVYLDANEYIDFKNSIINDTFIFLINNHFLVPEQFDDAKLKKQILDFAKMFQKNLSGYNHFTIFPTTDCNARCFYCFEHGTKKIKMTEQTACDVADYIVNKSNGSPVSIQWFGGEPLYNKDVIDIISEKLTLSNIDFKSRMISNGYLFDEDTIALAVKKWNLKYVQITLDGTEEIYNMVKAYIYKDSISPFKKVLNNIQLLLKNNIRVLIRLNIDKHNAADLYKLVDILEGQFDKHNENFSIYAYPLYENRLKRERNYDDKFNVIKELISLTNYIQSKDLSLKSALKNEYLFGACIADCDNAVTILPDGKIGKCDHYSDSNFIGDIYTENENVEIIKKWKEHYPIVDMCLKCPVFPQCNRLKNCPETNQCDEFEQKHIIMKTINKMKNSYKYFKKTEEETI